MSRFGKLLQVEHVLFERIGLHRVHAFSEAKIGAFNFSSLCCDDEYVTNGGTTHVDSHSLFDCGPWIAFTWHFATQNLN
jgi:hypothetical protein